MSRALTALGLFVLTLVLVYRKLFRVAWGLP